MFAPPVIRRWSLPLCCSLLAACVSDDLAPSIWPPANFALQVEEVRFEGQQAHVLRRVTVDAEGLVVYGTSSRPLVDDLTGTSLPVFERLAVYQLEPDCVRALARKVDRLLPDDANVDPGEPAPTSILLRWRAFDVETSFTAQGRPRGRVHDVLREVAGYLPAGESFETPLSGVRPVLRGTPAPREDVRGALAAYEELRRRLPLEPGLLLEGFALACSAGDRGNAERWLEAWAEADERLRAGAPAFPDQAAQLDAELLRRMLPQLQ